MDLKLMLEIEDEARTGYVYSENKKYRLYIHPYTRHSAVGDDYFRVYVENYSFWNGWKMLESFYTSNRTQEENETLFWQLLSKYGFVDGHR